MTHIFSLAACPVDKVCEKMHPFFLFLLVSCAVSLQGWTRKVGIYTVLGFDGKAILRSSCSSSDHLSTARTVALTLLFIGCVTHCITKRVYLKYSPKGGLF